MGLWGISEHPYSKGWGRREIGGLLFLTVPLTLYIQGA